MSIATNAKIALVTLFVSSLSRLRRQASTEIRSEVRPVSFRLAKKVTSSPTKTGLMNSIASTATVAQRPRASRVARLPAARSICHISQPPKISPAGLVSDGMAIVRITDFPFGAGISISPSNATDYPVIDPKSGRQLRRR